MCARRSTSSTVLTLSTKARCSWRARRPTSWATKTSAGFISANASRCSGAARGESMALTQRLELKQGQALVMTPQLQQAIKLLQLSNLELAEYVEIELEKNPLLEREDLEAGEAETGPREAQDAVEGGDAAPLDKTLATEDFGTTRQDCEATLAVLQGFDPAGVMARDLTECLALQLKERDRLDPAMQVLLTRLDLVAKRDLAALSTLCELEISDISDMIAEIRALNPKPGLAFGTEPVRPVVPDVYVREGADGSWQVELNSDTLPRVLVNSRYYAEVNKSARSKDDKNYLTECLNGANWLVKSLDQRARTIVKVAIDIARRTVAKYREALRIPSSVERRRLRQVEVSDAAQ